MIDALDLQLRSLTPLLLVAAIALAYSFFFDDLPAIVVNACIRIL